MKDEDGGISVLAAAVLLVLVVLAMCVADLAKVLGAKSDVQAAADAAALAAAQDLAYPASGSDPARSAATYAAANGGTLTSCRCSVADPTRADVIVTRELPTLLIPWAVSDVTASASAAVNEASPAPAPMPATSPSADPGV